jgi:hypothetical protein
MPNYHRMNQCFGNRRPLYRRGLRTRGPLVFRKIPHTQKCTQVNRRNIIPVIKVTKIALAQTCMGVFFIRSVSDANSATFFLPKPPANRRGPRANWRTATNHRLSADHNFRNTDIIAVELHIILNLLLKQLVSDTVCTWRNHVLR